jgi:methionyl-tRNA formyltransferase
MRILFIGCVESSEMLLSTLLDKGFDICAVVTKKKSVLNSDFVDLSEVSVKHEIPVHFFSTDDYESYHQFIKSSRPDIIYCFGWSHILPDDILKIPRMGVVGFHPTKLPQNRGRHPLIWTLVLGLRETASTFFIMRAGVDNGDIISQVSVNVHDCDTARTLYDRIINTAMTQVVEFTEQFQNNSIVLVKQDERNSNEWRKRSEIDGQIDFRMRAKTICRLVRALSPPYVGAHFIHCGKSYKVWKAESVESDETTENFEFGKVIEVYSERSFLVKADEELLKIVDCDNISISEGEYL